MTRLEYIDVEDRVGYTYTVAVVFFTIFSTGMSASQYGDILPVVILIFLGMLFILITRINILGGSHERP